MELFSLRMEEDDSSCASKRDRRESKEFNRVLRGAVGGGNDVGA